MWITSYYTYGGHITVY